MTTNQTQTQTPFAIGKPNYAGGGDNKPSLVFHKLGHKEPKQRVIVVRIAPPIGPLAERGTWAMYV